MIKVPGTPEGVPAIKHADRRGHQRQRHAAVRARGLRGGRRGLHRRASRRARPRAATSRQRRQRGQLLRQPHRHAVDDRRSPRSSKTAAGADKARLEALLGKVAIANAKLAYQRYQEIFAGRAGRRSRRKGAQTAAPALGQHRHQEPALPRRALRRGADRPRHRQHHAARDDRRLPRPRRAARQPGARTCRGRPATLRRRSSKAGISLTEVTDELLDDGRQEVRRAVRQAAGGRRAASREANCGAASTRRRIALPAALADARSQAPLEDWDSRKAARGVCGAATPSLWTGSDEASWLGWLGIVDDQLDERRAAARPRRRGQGGGFTHALLLGMGGSSLCPEVLAETFGTVAGFPELLVLDSTDPAQIRAIEDEDRPREDAVHRLEQVGQHARAEHLQGSTSSTGVAQARRRRQGRPAASSPSPIPARKLETGGRGGRLPRTSSPACPSIGGRYSALSNFGMVPAAVMGVDVRAVPRRGRAHGPRLRARACPPEQNPGVVLGTILGPAGATAAATS